MQLYNYNNKINVDNQDLAKENKSMIRVIKKKSKSKISNNFKLFKKK